MKRIVVTDELASKLKRFPQRVQLCDDEGNAVRIFERVAEPADARAPENEMLQTLQELF